MYIKKRFISVYLQKVLFQSTEIVRMHCLYFRQFFIYSYNDDKMF